MLLLLTIMLFIMLGMFMLLMIIILMYIILLMLIMMLLFFFLLMLIILFITFLFIILLFLMFVLLLISFILFLLIMVLLLSWWPSRVRDIQSWILILSRIPVSWCVSIKRRSRFLLNNHTSMFCSPQHEWRTCQDYIMVSLMTTVRLSMPYLHLLAVSQSVIKALQ